MASGSIGNVRQVSNGNGAPGPISVPSTTVVYSRAFRVNMGTAFGCWYQAGNGSGTANMKIELEQSYIAPTTEGSADAAWIVGAGVAPIETSLSGSTAVVKSLSPVPMKYARLKITGLAANPADATLNMWIFQQEL